jgi:type VI secretion system protein ImpL
MRSQPEPSGLLQQIGRRNAESTLYENMLKSVRRNFADVSLEDMTSGTDARRLFTTDEVVPACYPPGREGGFSRPSRKAANSADEIDWVLSDSKSCLSDSVAGGAESASDPTLLHRFRRQLAEFSQQSAT